MKIRLFGHHDCNSCLRFIKIAKAVGLEFDYVDAMCDETQTLCDMYNVDKLPHIQILDDHDDVLYDFIGYLEPGILRSLILPE